MGLKKLIGHWTNLRNWIQLDLHPLLLFWQISSSPVDPLNGIVIIGTTQLEI